MVEKGGRKIEKFKLSFPEVFISEKSEGTIYRRDKKFVCKAM